VLFRSQNNELEQELRQTHAVLNVKKDVIKTMTTQMARSNHDIAAKDYGIKKIRAELEENHRQLGMSEARNEIITKKLSEQNHLNITLAEEIKGQGEELRRKEDEIIHWEIRMIETEEKQRQISKNCLRDLDSKENELSRLKSEIAVSERKLFDSKQNVTMVEEMLHTRGQNACYEKASIENIVAHLREEIMELKADRRNRNLQHRNELQKAWEEKAEYVLENNHLQTDLAEALSMALRWKGKSEYRRDEDAYDVTKSDTGNEEEGGEGDYSEQYDIADSGQGSDTGNLGSDLEYEGVDCSAKADDEEDKYGSFVREGDGGDGDGDMCEPRLNERKRSEKRLVDILNR
jgi:hypothetical protein